MGPMHFLASQPLWLSGLLLVVLTTSVAMLGPVLVRRSYSLERLSTNNEVAGFKFAVLGVIFAVMLGFAVIVAWEKFSEGEQVVASEAGAVASLYRLSAAFDPAARTAMRARLGEYVHAAVTEDWPAMAEGRPASGPSRALSALYAAVLDGRKDAVRDVSVMSEMFLQLDHVTEARRHRLVLAEGIVPGVLWVTLWAGALATIGFTFFFGTQSLRAQTLMTGLLAFLVFLALFVITSVDYPFTGPVSVKPHALELARQDFSEEGASAAAAH